MKQDCVRHISMMFETSLSLSPRYHMVGTRRTPETSVFSIPIYLTLIPALVRTDNLSFYIFPKTSLGYTRNIDHVFSVRDCCGPTGYSTSSDRAVGTGARDGPDLVRVGPKGDVAESSRFSWLDEAPK